MVPNPDKLLKEIRNEGKTLSVYEGTRQDDLVGENVDERILRLLGLEDVFDIDYATYISLLRERVASNRMLKQELPTEELEILTNEFKSVRNKVGRFKIKKKKFSTEGRSAMGRKPSISKEKFFLTGSKFDSLNGDTSERSSINKLLNELLVIVKADYKLDENKIKKNKISAENLRRTKKENTLEENKSGNFLKNVAKKALTPFQGILDKILKFLGFTALGFVFDKFYKWWTNPQNEKKVELLGNFLRDWWPALSSAALLFLTPLGGFIRGTVRLLRTQLPRLINLIRLNPLASAAVLGGTAAVGFIGSKALSDSTNSKVRDSVGYKNGGTISPILRFTMGGGIDSLQNQKVTSNSGENITGAGVDTQLIAAQPGEMVIPVQTVNEYGSNFFMNLIRSSGKTGIPRMVNNIQMMNQGGIVLPGTGRVMQPSTKGRLRQTLGSGYAGKSQFKLFGMPIPFTQKNQMFNDSDLQRYNNQGGNRVIEKIDSYSPGATYHKTVPRQTSRQTPKSSSPSFTSEAFKNFGKNIQTIKDSSKRFEDAMRDHGYEPDGYTNLRGQPINLGPQSKVSPVGTPVITSETQMIVLPAKTTVAKKPSVPVKEGSDIPEFSIISQSAGRGRVTASLGISDLVGA